MVTTLALLALQTQVMGSISGLVRDGAGRAPATYALVAATESGRTHTGRVDSLGRYRIDSIPLGPIRVTARRIGYTMALVDTAVTTAKPRLKLDFTLRAVHLQSAAVPDDATQEPITSRASYEGFSLNLFRETTRHASDSNVFISPASAAFALAMTYGGSHGATEVAMRRALRVDGPPEKIGRDDAQLVRSLADQSSVRLSIANSIWASANRPFLPSFLDWTRNNYSAEVRSMVLHGSAAQRAINGWVAKATEDKIQSLLPDTLPDETAMVVLSAVYFKGIWKHKFDTLATRSHAFTLGNGQVVTRKLMFRHERIQYHRGNHYQAVRLPYRGDRIAMYVFLPDSGIPPADVVATIDTTSWRAAMGGFTAADLRLGLPRFRVECQTTLNEPLDSLGMAVAFDPKRADFNRMLPRSFLRDTNLYISKIIQQTYVDVDEQGTEAAAATGVIMSVLTSVHLTPEMIVDRPFIVAIRDDHTGLILFLGQINDPLQR
ncbi:MAG TPA: serpin family protein [Gemmatimonadaceae bacterium]|nr:serpin family protein [Gemmatimonadaceae bacterium]